MSAAAVLSIPCDFAAPRHSILPWVWAIATPPQPQPAPPRPQLAFYRKYTHALLRRYVRLSLAVGRTPSLLGREMFRAKVTHCHTQSFEDIVIFSHDVERCLEQLTPEQQHLVARITLQEFTVGEVSTALGLDPRTVISRHRGAIDRLTAIFLETKILEPANCCQ